MNTGDHAVINTAGDAPNLVVQHDGEFCEPLDHGQEAAFDDAGWVAVTVRVDRERCRLIFTYFGNKLVVPPDVVGIPDSESIQLEKQSEYNGFGIAYRFPDEYSYDDQFVIARADEVA